MGRALIDAVLADGELSLVAALDVKGSSALGQPVGDIKVTSDLGAIDKADVPTWLERLETLHIAIESRVDWPRGGHSIYFRDSDGRSVELATPGTWASY